MAVSPTNSPPVAALQFVRPGLVVLRGVGDDEQGSDGGVSGGVCERRDEEIGRGEVFGVRDQLRRLRRVSDGGDSGGDGGEGGDHE